MFYLHRRATLGIKLILLLCMLLVGCKKSPSKPPDESSPLSPLAIVPPQIESPLPTLQQAQDEAEPPPPTLTPFALDEPLLVGATRVTGKGPAGTFIMIVDVTMATERIGGGEIEADGTFDFETISLPPLHRIGIMASESLPPQVQANLGSLWGEGAIELPMIGTVFASAMTTGE